MFIKDESKLKDFYSKNRLIQLVPGIEITSKGRLFCTFYSGKASETLGNYCVVVKSDDGGSTWSEPIFAAYDGQMNRCFDPVLWIDPLGRLWFTWAGGHRYGVYGVICDDPDADELGWSDEFYIGEGVMMNKPTVLSTGEWLFPIALWDYWYTKDTFNQIKNYGDFYLEEYMSRMDHSGANIYKTTNNGKSFTMIGGARLIDQRSHDEHMVYEQKNGVLVLLSRVKYGIARSYSYDRGATWTVAKPSGLTGPASRFHVRRLKSGKLLLINHDNYTGRNNLTAFLSEDDGKTWPYKLLLDERKEVSYPDMAEGADGYLYITYDRERGAYKNTFEEALTSAREILLAKITEDDIINGKLSSKGSFLKHIISKLGEYCGNEKELFSGHPPMLDPQEFVKTVMTYKDRSKIFDALYVYYPLDFKEISDEDVKNVDELIDIAKLSVYSDSALKDCLFKLTDFLSTLPLVIDTQCTEEYVMQMIEYISQNAIGDLDLASFTQKLGISRHYACYLFLKKTEMDVFEYRDRCRYTEAKKMLISTDCHYVEIAKKCGFSSVEYFVREFVEKEKISPKDYRTAHRH